MQTFFPCKVIHIFLPVFAAFLLVGCAPTASKPSPELTFTAELIRPTPTPTFTATPAIPQMRLAGKFGAGFFSGVFRSPDGKRIFVLMNGKELRWYDAKTFELEGRVALEDTYAPRQIIFGPDPDLVVVIDDLNIPVINIKSQKIIGTINLGVWGIMFGIQFSPDAKFLFYRAGYFHTQSHSFDLEVWDIQQSQSLQFSMECQSMSDPVISPDGKWVAVGCDNLVEILNTQTGSVLRTLKSHTGNVTRVAISKDGGRLISADENGTVCWWNSQTGQLYHTFALGKEITRLSFVENERQALAEFKYASPEIIDLKAQQVKAVPVIPPTIDPFAVELHKQGYAETMWGDTIVGISPDGKTLAVGSVAVLLWDIETRQSLDTLENPTGYPIRKISFGPDGSTIAGLTYGSVLLWDLTANAHPRLAKIAGLADEDRHRGLSFSPDGKMIAVGHGTNIEIWNAQTAQQIKTLHMAGNINYVFGAYFSSDGQLIYAVVDLPNLTEEGENPNRKGIQIWNVEKNQMTKQINFPQGHGWDVPVLQWPLFSLPNGNDKLDWIEIWDLQTEKLQKLPFSFDPESLAFSEDHKLLFANGYSPELFYIWQVETGKLAYVSKEYNNYNLELLGTSNFLASTDRGPVQLFDISELVEHAHQPNLTPVALPAP